MGSVSVATSLYFQHGPQTLCCISPKNVRTFTVSPTNLGPYETTKSQETTFSALRRSRHRDFLESPRPPPPCVAIVSSAARSCSSMSPRPGASSAPRSARPEEKRKEPVVLYVSLFIYVCILRDLFFLRLLCLCWCVVYSFRFFFGKMRSNKVNRCCCVLVLFDKKGGKLK